MTALALADAIAAALNAATFSLAFTATRGLLPHTDDATLSELQVTVIPTGPIHTELSARTVKTQRITVAIVVQKRATEIDGLINLVGELDDFLCRTRIAGGAWSSSVIDPLYAPDNLNERRQFASVINVTFQILRRVSNGG